MSCIYTAGDLRHLHKCLLAFPLFITCETSRRPTAWCLCTVMISANSLMSHCQRPRARREQVWAGLCCFVLCCIVPTVKSYFPGLLNKTHLYSCLNYYYFQSFNFLNIYSILQKNIGLFHFCVTNFIFLKMYFIIAFCELLSL